LPGIQFCRPPILLAWYPALPAAHPYCLVSSYAGRHPYGLEFSYGGHQSLMFATTLR
jgi:hypothetical protein